MHLSVSCHLFVSPGPGCTVCNVFIHRCVYVGRLVNLTVASTVLSILYELIISVCVYAQNGNVTAAKRILHLCMCECADMCVGGGGGVVLVVKCKLNCGAQHNKAEPPPLLCRFVRYIQ